MASKLTALIVIGFGAVIISAGVGCFGHGDSAPTGVPSNGDTGPEPASGPLSSTDPIAPTPIPVADARDPTPINDPTLTLPDATTEPNEPGNISLAPILPGLGWGNTIDLLDLLDLLPPASLGDILDPATDNPGSFTDLELLCQDMGISDSICRSRYGAP